MEDMIKADYGIMPHGIHAGKYFDQLEDNDIIRIVESLTFSKVDKAIRNYIFPWYENIKAKLEKERVEEIASRKPESDYIGNIGDAIENLEVTILFVGYIKHNGVTILSMVDSEGNSISAFYNGSDKFKKGQTFNINGIIRSHKEYNGAKQTGLSKIKRS